MNILSFFIVRPVGILRRLFLYHMGLAIAKLSDEASERRPTVRECANLGIPWG